MLDRPVYGYAEVDRLLRLTPGTTKGWVNGYERGGKWYDPVIREQRTDSPWVSWGEFVETRLLAEFRPTIPMLRLRPAVQRLREYFGRQNPLAYAAPFLSGRARTCCGCRMRARSTGSCGLPCPRGRRCC